MPFDPQLLDYCTPRQREVLEAYRTEGSGAAAARALGDLDRTYPDKILRDVKRKAARQGYAPGHFNSGTAPGYTIGKVTIQRNAAGEVMQSWERQSPDELHAAEAQEAALRALVAEIPREAPVAAPEGNLSDLCALYTLTDAHVGMLAWHREGGQDWDLRIAEDTIVGCFAETIRQMPNAEQAVFNQLGDLLHYDSLTAVTPTSGHILDADSRFTKMVESAVRILRRVIRMLLAKHAHVRVIMAEGNHDMASSVWLRTMFKALFENEPRVSVDDSALPYYCFEFGNVFLGFHHSHIKKMEQLPGFMAAQFPREWGRTTKRYCHTGDKHHAAEKDGMGMHVIQHPTLAARDAYAARGGWHSERAMQGITYHRSFGQVGRVIVTPEMLQAA